MPNPTLQDITADEFLSNMSVASMQDDAGFVSHLAFPVVTVDEETGKYWIFDKSDTNRPDAQLRRPGTQSARKDFRITNGTFTTANTSIHADLPDKLRKTRNSPLANDKAMVQVIGYDLALTRELAWFTTFMTSGVWTTDKDGDSDFTKWDDASSSLISDVYGWSTDIKTVSTKRPNTLIVTADVWDVMKDDEDVVDRYKHTGQAITKELIAGLLELDRILVADAVYETAKETQTSSMAHMATKKLLLCYVHPEPELMEPSAGYTISWTEFDDIKGPVKEGGAAIRQFRMEELRSDRYEGDTDYEHKVIAADCGLFAEDVIA